MVKDDDKNKIEDYTKNLLKEELEQHKSYDNEKCGTLPKEISNKVCEYIKGLESGDRFIVNTTVFERGNVGLSMAATCMFDEKND